MKNLTFIFLAIFYFDQFLRNFLIWFLKKDCLYLGHCMRNRWNAVGMLLSFPIGTFRCSGFLYQQNQNIHIFKVLKQYYINPTLFLRNLNEEGLDLQHCMQITDLSRLFTIFTLNFGYSKTFNFQMWNFLQKSKFMASKMTEIAVFYILK